MREAYFAGGVKIEGEQVPFTRRTVRDRYTMYVPDYFKEDKNLVSNYTYFFSTEKSPLSIAIKHVSGQDGEKQIRRYFAQEPETLDCLTDGGHKVYFRELVTGSSFISVYSLRFAVQLDGDLLFGCFNCSADSRDNWREVALQMLQSIRSS